MGPLDRIGGALTLTRINPVIANVTNETENHFDYHGNMETISAAQRLAALGHETRLLVFRRLVEAGHPGLAAGALAESLDLPSATLSFHLAHLSRVGLITGRQSGRFIYYAADYAAMNELIAFLTRNCCQGEPCLAQPANSCAADH